MVYQVSVWFEIGLLASVIIALWYVCTNIVYSFRKFLIACRRHKIDRAVQRYLKDNPNIECLYKEMEES